MQANVSRSYLQSLGYSARDLVRKTNYQCLPLRRGLPKTVLVHPPQPLRGMNGGFVTIVIVTNMNSVSDNVVTGDSKNSVPVAMQSGSGQGRGVQAGLTCSDSSQGLTLHEPFRFPHPGWGPCFLLCGSVVRVHEEMCAERPAGSVVRAGAGSADVVALVAGPGLGSRRCHESSPLARALPHGAPWTALSLLLSHVAVSASSWSWARSSRPHSTHVSRRPTLSQGTST